MKILIVSSPSKLNRTRALWSRLGQLAEAQLETLGKGAFARLNDLVARGDFSGFDRVVIDSNLRRMGVDFKLLPRIPNLVLFEFDFIHNYLPESTYYRKYELILKSLPPHRIVVSSLFIKSDLQTKGFDAAYSAKAYDPALIRNLNRPRDIEIGFIGRTKHRVYRQRRAWLDQLQKEVGLHCLRTEEGQDYNATLNRIKIFVCPDLGFKELMIKNFEAMAAGCLLVTAKPCPEESNHLGLADLENVVFFDSYAELVDKLQALRKDPDRVQQIAQSGHALASARHSWANRAANLYPMLLPKLQAPPPLTWKERLQLRFWP